jgi:hypothetical protein
MEADAMARTDRRFWKLGVDWIDAILHRSDEEPGNESCAVADASRIDAGQRK